MARVKISMRIVGHAGPLLLQRREQYIACLRMALGIVSGSSFEFDDQGMMAELQCVSRKDVCEDDACRAQRGIAHL